MFLRSLYSLYFAFILSWCWFLDAGIREPAFTCGIPMRDGTQLQSDFYLPADASPGKRYPCILLRNPSGRKAEPWIGYAALAEAGYVVVFQDTRSSTDSEGCHIPYWSEGWGDHQDGYDTVEWLAKSPYCNGKVATLGQSAAGITQLLMGPTLPPSLCCQYIGTATASLYQHAIYPGGLFQKNLVEGWLKLHASHPMVYLTVTSQPHYNDFWNHFDTVATATPANAPAILYTGWYDTFLEGTIAAFETRQQSGGAIAKGSQKLLIGPWTHHWPAEPGLKNAILPTTAFQLPQDFSPLRWFDFHLKGTQNGAEQIAPVTYYLMGTFDGSESSGNRWKTAEVWPLSHTPTELFLKKDNTLSFKPIEKAAEGTLSFKDDPAHPIPTIGGSHLFLVSGPLDQRPIESSPNVLVFTTEPLENELTLTGPVKAELNLSCNRSPAAVVVRLTDLYPDGKSLLLMEAGKTVDAGKVEINLGHTAIVIAKGHALRLIVAGSSVPRFATPNYGASANRSGIATPNSAEFIIELNNQSRLILPVAN